MSILLITVLYRRSRSKAARNEGKSMPSVARMIELSATSEESFEDAISQGVERATSTLRNVESAWIKDKNVLIENNEVAAYKVTLPSPSYWRKATNPLSSSDRVRAEGPR